MDVRKQVCAVIEDVLAAEKPHFNPVKLLAVGCSSSEIVGGSIGHDSTYQVGEEVAQAILDKAAEHGFDAAFQCCEHLNRALVMERAAAEKRGYEIVCVVPQPKAGGSLATAAYRRMRDPVGWKRYPPTRALTSAARWWACICGRWRCRYGRRTTGWARPS